MEALKREREREETGLTERERERERRCRGKYNVHERVYTCQLFLIAIESVWATFASLDTNRIHQPRHKN